MALTQPGWCYSWAAHSGCPAPRKASSAGMLRWAIRACPGEYDIKEPVSRKPPAGVFSHLSPASFSTDPRPQWFYLRVILCPSPSRSASPWKQVASLDTVCKCPVSVQPDFNVTDVIHWGRFRAKLILMKCFASRNGRREISNVVQ